MAVWITRTDYITHPFDKNYDLYGKNKTYTVNRGYFATPRGYFATPSENL